MLVAHSESHTFAYTANPVTRTVTRCPFRSRWDGVTVTLGWVQENPGAGDWEQAFGFVGAVELLPAEAPAVAAFAPAPAGADDRLLHETASRHTMTAVTSALRPDM